jgi:hypothetical protein
MTTGKATKDRKYDDQRKSYKGAEITMTTGKATKGQTIQ